MRVIIAGSRTITNPLHVDLAVDMSGWFEQITEIISGCADGVDQLGIKFAEEMDIVIAEFPANWKMYGKQAGFKRNEDMAQYADGLIAIRENHSRGTSHMIQTMRDLGKPVFLMEFTRYI
jgi:predicted Rossmann fold nucleotide-binding protein DprA/Smf involved in DNA uptake